MILYCCTLVWFSWPDRKWWPALPSWPKCTTWISSGPCPALPVSSVSGEGVSWARACSSPGSPAVGGQGMSSFPCARVFRVSTLWSSPACSKFPAGKPECEWHWWWLRLALLVSSSTMKVLHFVAIGKSSTIAVSTPGSWKGHHGKLMWPWWGLTATLLSRLLSSRYLCPP